MIALFDKSSIPVVVFVALSLIIAALCHWRIRRLIIASLLAALASAISFQIIGYFVIGYLDPFVLIALVTSFAVSFVMALFVGFLMRYSRGNAT
jgi:hypothetical protein